MRNLENIPRITVPITEFALLVQRYGYEARGRNGFPRSGTREYIAPTLAESIRNMVGNKIIAAPMAVPEPNTKHTTRKEVYVIDRMNAEKIFDVFLSRMQENPEGIVPKSLALIHFSEEVKCQLLSQIFGSHPRE